MADLLTEVEEVQDKTTDDTDVLPLEKIESYLVKYQRRKREARILLAAADIIDLLNRDNYWQSETLGRQMGQQNLMPERARQYRKRAATLDITLV